MNRRMLRPLVASGIAAVVCLVMGSQLGAAVRTGIPVVARFVANGVNLADNHPVPVGRIDIVIERWSTDQELADLRSHAGPSMQMLDVLQSVRRRAGTLFTPGLQALGTRSRERRPQSILFAQQIQTPAGRRVVIATDKQLGFGDTIPDPKMWDGSQLTSEFEFTLVDIRFNADGVGTGKIAPESKVVFDPAIKAFEIKDYAAQPDRLTDVRADER